MYESVRQQALDRCDWKGGVDGRLALQYVEAWRYDGDVRADNTNFDTGQLSSEAELKDWLARKSASSKPQQNDKLLGRVRLLVCDRTSYSPLDFALSRQGFESLEDTFKLSPLTLASFESEAGTYSRFLIYADDNRSKLRQIHTILKAPQKREIFNWGLSLSYDLESSTTSGFLYGTGIDHLRKDRCPQNHQQGLGSCPIDSFVQSIRAAVEVCDHPMLVPCLFLSEHLRCINDFGTKGTVLTETVEIESHLGVTKVGQSAYLQKSARTAHVSQFDDSYKARHTSNPYFPTLESPRTLTREETESLTVRINTQSTRVAFTARSPEWNLACAHFILKCLKETEPCLIALHPKGQHECKQLLEHNITLAEAAASHIAVISQRLSLQLQVLYNFVAQLDNQTSAELAASASRDSTSMKILAFISALFLPGSFVATMFSMDVFDWKQDYNGAVVSENFWVFWAVAVPLTVVTILGWAAWWSFEMGRFDRKISSIRGKADTKSAAVSGP